MVMRHIRRSGPAIAVFGRLAPGATLDTAQVELTAVGQRVASEQPATHAQLQPHVSPYTMLDAGPSQDNDEIGIFASIYFFAVMLLVLVCSNVALLLFARAATRESELAVRSALGASRGRIIARMFAEALVLGGVAAVQRDIRVRQQFLDAVRLRFIHGDADGRAAANLHTLQ